MLLNVDRRRIYMFSGIAVFLLLMLGLYHAPAYVPAEVSRMKTSVSTWLKGTEPSLNDELYKDSPHFSSTTKQNSQSSKANDVLEPDPFEIKETPGDTDSSLPDDMLHAMPMPTDDQPDLLPPDAADSRPSAASHTANAKPDIDDFVNVLPPVDLLNTASSAPSPSRNLHESQVADPTTQPTHHRHLEEVTKPGDIASTTLATHVSPARPFNEDIAMPTNAREAFENEE